MVQKTNNIIKLKLNLKQFIILCNQLLTKHFQKHLSQ
jgi:hypothetical protein